MDHAPSSCPPSQAILIGHETGQTTYTFRGDNTLSSVFSGALSERFATHLRVSAARPNGGTGEICTDSQNMVQASLVHADAGSLGETYTCAMDVNQTCVCEGTRLSLHLIGLRGGERRPRSPEATWFSYFRGP